MQLNNSSKKKKKIAEEAVAGPELSAASEVTPKPRAVRSSKPKKNETGESSVPKHHHKINSVAAAAPIPETLAALSTALGTTPSPKQTHTVTTEEIAKLAHSFWEQRNYADGSAEEDWLRAERQLSGRA
jgi:hypothetical protein